MCVSSIPLSDIKGTYHLLNYNQIFVNASFVQFHWWKARDDIAKLSWKIWEYWMGINMFVANLSWKSRNALVFCTEIHTFWKWYWMPHIYSLNIKMSSYGRLIFNMGITIPMKDGLLLRRGTGLSQGLIANKFASQRSQQIAWCICCRQNNLQGIILRDVWNALPFWEVIPITIYMPLPSYNFCCHTIT